MSEICPHWTIDVCNWVRRCLSSKPYNKPLQVGIVPSNRTLLSVTVSRDIASSLIAARASADLSSAKAIGVGPRRDVTVVAPDNGNEWSTSITHTQRRYYRQLWRQLNCYPRICSRSDSILKPRSKFNEYGMVKMFRKKIVSQKHGEALLPVQSSDLHSFRGKFKGKWFGYRASWDEAYTEKGKKTHESLHTGKYNHNKRIIILWRHDENYSSSQELHLHACVRVTVVLCEVDAVLHLPAASNNGQRLESNDNQIRHTIANRKQEARPDPILRQGVSARWYACSWEKTVALLVSLNTQPTRHWLNHRHYPSSLPDMTLYEFKAWIIIDLRQ